MQNATRRFDCASPPQHIRDQARCLLGRAAEPERRLATAAPNFGLRQLQVASILLGTGTVRPPGRNQDALASQIPNGVIGDIAMDI
ncbi:MAG: hypothetical protein HUJ24_09505 [Rhodobacteraceae bacterium]|nr:hypothetical protein [Paracoccaceae bacterium]